MIRDYLITAPNGIGLFHWNTGLTDDYALFLQYCKVQIEIGQWPRNSIVTIGGKRTMKLEDLLW